ncbi:hypothetical protein CEXT_406211 [Caerostris extrusa]|uniref:Uncharacterized protein n=1 Tax=Caerostris extrusa TaxID=172846 RepID=A0AAV4MF00_CAEEX|nr:hypothetical protein CEXT_406211 [Caerostris extrusa]
MGKASHAQSKRQLPKTNEGHPSSCPSSRLIDGGIHSSRGRQNSKGRSKYFEHQVQDQLRLLCLDLRSAEIPLPSILAGSSQKPLERASSLLRIR